MLQRAMIVEALVAEPGFLICDNVTQPLDVAVAWQITRLLKALRDNLDAGILFVATSVPIVREVADGVLVLSQGRIVERSTPDELVRVPRHASSRDLLARTAKIWGDGPPPAAPPAATPRKAILEVQEVTKTYLVPHRSRFFGKQAVQAVRDAGFDVLEGDNFGLVGKSGCGKSTLSRLLSWIERPDRGRILFDGQDIAQMSRAALVTMRRGFQLLLQDPYNCIPPNLTVGRTIALLLKVHGLGRREAAAKVEAVMAEVGLDLFARLQRSHRLTYLFISHDLAMVRKVCSRIVVMSLGKVVEFADTATVFFDPGHPYTKALLSAVPVLEEHRCKAEDCLLEREPPSPIDLPIGCSFRARCPAAFESCRAVEPGLVTRGPGRVAACHRLAPPADARAA